MPTVFTVLNQIRERPEIYVGGEESDRASQLETLETLLYGYGLAVELHDLDDPGRGFVKSFGAYLNQRFGWPTALGPVVAILEGIRPGEDPCKEFWTAIDDFQACSPSAGGSDTRVREPPPRDHPPPPGSTVSEQTKKHVGYIRDLAYLLRERTVEAQVDKEKSGSPFEEGREFGLRQALAWMQHQADAFGIPRDEIGLAGFDAMTEPVDPPLPHLSEDEQA